MLENPYGSMATADVNNTHSYHSPEVHPRAITKLRVSNDWVTVTVFTTGMMYFWYYKH
jgi:hypothetical protein